MGGKKKKKKPKSRPQPRSDFRGGRFGGPTQGSGTQHNTYVQQYAPVPTALAALPPLPREFTGRDDDLGFLLGLLDPAAQEGPAPVGVLAGLPGVGKTTLAYAVGHAAQERGWFTGVLLVGLRGYDPVPAQPEDVLDALLRSLGVSADHIPPTAAEQEALYRSQLDARSRADERLLVIADNASSSEQVRPLLPPGRHGLLVTSRRSLPGLGRLRTLNLLQPEAAVALLDAALRNADPDDTRVADDPVAAERVVLACGCLPLALQITAALLAADPGQPLAERADRLTGGEERLEGLDDGERNLRAAFDQSLDRLPPEQAELFRMLSLNKGPDISTEAATALTGKSRQVTENLLGQLALAHLVQRGSVRGRWQMHDLLREYAAEKAASHTAASRPARRRHEQAGGRLIGYYLHNLQAADTHFDTAETAASAGRFDSKDEALGWLDAERANLIAAAETESAPVAGDLAFALGRYLNWRRRFQDLHAVASLALDASRKTASEVEAAGAWNNIGMALRELRRLDESVAAHETARDAYHRLGVVGGEADAWHNLGGTLHAKGLFDEATNAYETALKLRLELGDHVGAAGSWNNLGITLEKLGRLHDAVAAQETARSGFQEDGNTHGEAIAWNNLGTALRGLRRFDEAIDAAERAVVLLTETKDAFRTGQALGELAVTLAESGASTADVRATRLRAADAYEQAGAADEAADARAEADKST